MLALVIVLSGCLGNTSDGVDAEDESTTIVNNFYNNTTVEYNAPPVISGTVVYRDYWDSEQGVLIEDVFVSTSVAWDYDGTVVAFGIDLDMDGIIDANFTEAYDQYLYRYLNTTGDWINPQSYDDIQEGRNGCYQFLNLIAVDDDGASTIIPMNQQFKEGETTGTCTNEHPY